jgi:predicted extracellular nuclease
MKITAFTLLIFFISVFNTFSQKKATVIAFWNVENLYDTINDKTIDDEEWLPTSKNKWNTERYNKKLDHTATIISKIGVDEQKDGAAIIGLAEIENKNVLVDLINTKQLKSRKYDIVHFNSPDARGIDVALLYQKKYFKLKSSKTYTVKLPGDSSRATRDQLLVSGLLNGELTHVIVCHWPSRRGGEEKTNELRVSAAKVSKHIIDSILQTDKNARIILMGDLNDDPSNESIKSVIKTTKEANQSKDDVMFNPMENIHEKGEGTLSHKGKWNLFDQIIISPALLQLNKKSLTYSSAKINNFPEVCETNPKYLGQPLRTFAGGNYLGGYSDHFSVCIYLK